MVTPVTTRARPAYACFFKTRIPWSNGRCDGQMYEQIPHSMHAPNP